MKSRAAQKTKVQSIAGEERAPLDDRVINLSAYPNEVAVLAVTPGRISVNDVIADVEGGLHHPTGSDVDKARLKMAGVLKSCIQHLVPRGR